MAITEAESSKSDEKVFNIDETSCRIRAAP